MIRNNKQDFRLEVLKAFSDNGVLRFKIEVSNTTKDKDSHLGWNEIGTITEEKAYVNYGCDRRLHFGHPKFNE